MENKPILSAPGDIYIGESTIAELTERILSCDPIFAHGLAKMLAKVAKDVIEQTKDPVLQQIESAGSTTVLVGDAQFTYRNGKTSHTFTGIDTWDEASQVALARRMAVEERLEQLMRDEDYQAAVLAQKQAEAAVGALEEHLVETGKAIEVKHNATVAVRFLKSK